MDTLKSISSRAGSLLSGLKIENLNEVKTELEQSAKTKKLEEKQKAASDFEALLVGQMFKEMWKNVEGDKDSMFASEHEAIYRDMLNEELAKEIAEKQSIGIKDIILKDFK